MTENPATPAPMPTPVPTRTRLTRARNDKMIGGVCGGVARHFDVDATVVRVLAAIGLVLGFPWFGFLYLVAWAIMPQDPA